MATASVQVVLYSPPGALLYLAWYPALKAVLRSEAITCTIQLEQLHLMSQS